MPVVAQEHVNVIRYVSAIAEGLENENTCSVQSRNYINVPSLMCTYRKKRGEADGSYFYLSVLFT